MNSIITKQGVGTNEKLSAAMGASTTMNFSLTNYKKIDDVPNPLSSLTDFSTSFSKYLIVTAAAVTSLGQLSSAYITEFNQVPVNSVPTSDSKTAPIIKHIQVGDSAVPLSKEFALKLIKNAFINADYETFESGSESKFSLFINRFIHLLGKEGIKLLDSSLLEYKLSEEVIIEAIRTLGEMKNPATLTDRFIILVRYLDNESPFVRDAAALAFADLGVKSAIPYLELAADREIFFAVKSSFLNVIKELSEL